MLVLWCVCFLGSSSTLGADLSFSTAVVLFGVAFLTRVAPRRAASIPAVGGYSCAPTFPFLNRTFVLARLFPSVNVSVTNQFNPRQAYIVEGFSLSRDPPTILGLSTAGFAGSITGLVLLALLALFWILWYRQNKADQEAKPAVFIRGPWDWKYFRPTPTGAPPPVPAHTRPRPARSFSLLKREQDEALPHYEDTHTAPDVLLQTRRGLQLLPGAPPAKKKRSYRPFWRQGSANGAAR
ncbi:hypothetical protein C8R47DRAFT_1135947 [Mycena vitilis]|nr:hypothetical protein C8R47DRAFT_1135947 [Mycena vitilis]